MRVLRNSILIISSLTLFLILPATIFFQSLYSTVLKPYGTSHYFEQSEVNKDIELFLKSTFVNETNAIENPEARKIINLVVKRFVTEKVSSDWLVTKLDAIQISLWDNIMGVSDIVKAISIKELNQSFMQIADEEVEKLANDLQLPANMLKEDMLEELEDSIPTEVDFMKLYGLTEEDIDQLGFYYHQGKKLLVLVYLLIAMTLIFGVVIARGLRRSLKWIGLTAIIGGIISMIPAAILYVLSDNAILSIIELNGLLKEFEVSIIFIINLMLNDLARYIAIFSLGIIIIGTIILLFSSIIKKHSINKILTLP